MIRIGVIDIDGNIFLIYGGSGFLWLLMTIQILRFLKKLQNY